MDGLLAQALLTHNQNNARQTLHLADRSWELAQITGDPIRQAQAQLYRGHAYAGLQQWEVAAKAYRQALTRLIEADKEAMAAEPRAGLAAIALAQGELALALEQVEAILPVLAVNRRAGVDEPLYTYWVCHRVLVASGDPRADPVLEQAIDLLHHSAAHITDDASRRLFLERALTRYNLD